MSKAIMIIGASGSGKTTSMRNLDPKTTFYIDTDGKGLSWRGWRTQYNKQAKNYFKTDDAEAVYALMQEINEKQKHIKTLVIDTLNGIMVADEMRRMKDNNFDKWKDLAISVYNIVNFSNNMRDDLTVILLGHTQTSDDGFTCLLTNGKKLNKICLESKMTTVLLAKKIDDQYVFETTAHNSTAKTPMGAYDGIETVPNDIVEVIKVLSEY